MSKRNDHHDDGAKEATDPPAGPTDQGRKGGMATREQAPDVATKGSKRTSD